MDTNKYSVPSAETGVTTLLGKVFKDGLNQSELAAAYDDVSKDYDKVLSRVYTVGEFFCCLYVYYPHAIFTKETHFRHNDTYFNHFLTRNLILNFYPLICTFKAVITSNR